MPPSSSSSSGARKGIALLTIVGTIVGGHGRRGGSATPPRSYSTMFHGGPAASVPSVRSDCDDRHDSSRSVLGDAMPTLSLVPLAASAAASEALCARGGAVDDGPPRRREYDYDAPRRSGYDREGRDRPQQRHGARPSRDARGPDPRGRSDDGPRHHRGDRDRRYGGRDDDIDGFGDRSSRSRDARDDGRGYYDARDRGERNSRGYRPSNDGPEAPSEEGKGKKWFTLKKDKTKSKEDESKLDEGNVPPIPPPPPPPPPPPGDSAMSSPGAEFNPAGTERTPIHYMFPTTEEAAEERKLSDATLDADIRSEKGTDLDAPEIPFLDVEEEEFSGRDGSVDRRRRRRDYDDDDSRRVSARRDAVTSFMSTRRGALKVRVGSMIVGAALGGFIGKSMMNDPMTMSMAISFLLFITGFLRNDYGELSRALGLAFVLTLQRTSSVRKEHPTLPHIKAMIRQGPRRPFPPVRDGDSVWKYEPIYRDDPEFKMTYALLAMALVGSFCGGNVPILPAWMGGIAGAVMFASLTTGANARGDLGRSMGMRVVGLVQLVLAINTDLRILGKAATVAGLIFDKCMIMDRKHRIKDRIVAISKWGFDKVSRTTEQMKEEMQDERPERGRPERGRQERRYD